MSARRTLAEALRRLAARLDPPPPGNESPPALPDGDFLMLRMPNLLALARAEAATHGPGVLLLADASDTAPAYVPAAELDDPPASLGVPGALLRLAVQAARSRGMDLASTSVIAVGTPDGLSLYALGRRELALQRPRMA